MMARGKTPIGKDGQKDLDRKVLIRTGEVVDERRMKQPGKGSGQYQLL